MTYNFDCLWFTGYKPCQFKRACGACPHYSPAHPRIAILSLEAMGAVLRATCLLPAIQRQFPQAHITWVTLPQCRGLLENNPYIHRVITLNAASVPLLETLQFDFLYAVDKSLEAGALAERIQAKEKYGFGLSPEGAIRPFNEHAQYQYDVGLDDNLKFYQNTKPETQQTTETMGLVWKRDPYVLRLSDTEKLEVKARRKQMLGPTFKGIIGYNTGCSLLFPYKKFTIERAIETIKMWREEFPDYAVALLGGPEDCERQISMKKAFSNDPGVINTPTNEGLRSGILWIDSADLVFSGCSLGMHIAIALEKPTVAWFGVSCAQEIDLYDRGVKLQAKVGCSPCWKKSCSNEPKCFDQVDVQEIKSAFTSILKHR